MAKTPSRKKPTAAKAKTVKEESLDLDANEFTFPTDDVFDNAIKAQAEEAQEREAAKLSAKGAEGKDKEGQEGQKREEAEEEQEFTKEELLAVFDQILFEGEYRERLAIRGKLPFTLKSRTAGEAGAISRILDKTGFQMMATIEQHAALFNLAHSLVEYNNEDLSEMPAVNNNPDIMSRYDFIQKLPGTVVSALYMELSKFDRKVQLASIEGSENF